MLDIGIEPARKRQHQTNGYDADAARYRGDHRSALFRKQIFGGKRKRSQISHTGARLFLLVARRGRRVFCGRIVFSTRRRKRGFPQSLFRLGIVGIGVAFDQSVAQTHDTGSILLRQLGVVRNHDDEPLARDLFDQLHDLHARFRIQRARRFVGKQNIGFVDERARNRDALALSARKLIGLFVEFVSQPHALQSRLRAFLAFFARQTRYGKRKLDVPQHRLVGNEIVALEDKADAVIAVNVPIAVGKIFRGFFLYHKVAVGVVIESADNVKQSRFAAARLP